MMDSEKYKVTKVEITQIFTQEEVAFDYNSCQEAITRLNDYLDHELDESERADVVKHLQICQSCLQKFHFEETLITSIRSKISAACAPSRLKQKLVVAIRSLKS